MGNHITVQSLMSVSVINRILYCLWPAGTHKMQINHSVDKRFFTPYFLILVLLVDNNILVLIQLTNKDRALAVVRRVMDKFHQNSESNDPSTFCLVQITDKCKGECDIISPHYDYQKAYMNYCCK